MIPFIDLPSQQKKLEKPLKEAIDRVLTHGQYILGPEVRELEENLIAYTGAEFCTTVANGTDALQIGLMALEPEENDGYYASFFLYSYCRSCGVRIENCLCRYGQTHLI